ncbi:hypothetical protein RRG08_067349 [Elysia crispata]|uniref:Uncharacterized protein n=1 Tax=Elysia crispata TaxID=231223 RepID=A0AAE1EES7_9GAST|nr:hypothetical protein RRG08_067349 [Elysia crispata]
MIIMTRQLQAVWGTIKNCDVIGGLQTSPVQEASGVQSISTGSCNWPRTLARCITFTSMSRPVSAPEQHLLTVTGSLGGVVSRLCLNSVDSSYGIITTVLRVSG